MENVAKFGWILLPHSPYSPDLEPSNFHLFGLMKDGLYGQNFTNKDAITPAVRKWVAWVVAVHRWQKCIVSGGDLVERQWFVANNLLYPMALLYTFICCTFHGNKLEALLLESSNIIQYQRETDKAVVAKGLNKYKKNLTHMISKLEHIKCWTMIL
jgi:hypothetical protein